MYVSLFFHILDRWWENQNPVEAEVVLKQLLKSKVLPHLTPSDHRDWDAHSEFTDQIKMPCPTRSMLGQEAVKSANSPADTR